MLEVGGEESPMATDRPDPSEFLAMAQKMMRELFGEQRGDDDPWAEATRSARESRESRGPSAERQRENLTFALGTRAVEERQVRRRPLSPGCARPGRSAQPSPGG